MDTVVRQLSSWADATDDEFSDEDFPPVQLSQAASDLISRIQNIPPPVTLCIRNLPFAVKEPELQEFFGISGLQIRIQMIENRPAGFGFVTAQTQENACQVAKFLESEIGGRKIGIELSQRKPGGVKRYQRGREYRDHERNYDREERRGGYGREYNRHRGGRRGGRQGRGRGIKGGYVKENEQKRYYPKNEKKFQRNNGEEQKIHIPRQAPVQKKVNPFGEAKPVDTRQKEREFEQKLQKERDDKELETKKEKEIQEEANRRKEEEDERLREIEKQNQIERKKQQEIQKERKILQQQEKQRQEQKQKQEEANKINLISKIPEKKLEKANHHSNPPKFPYYPEQPRKKYVKVQPKIQTKVQPKFQPKIQTQQNIIIQPTHKEQEKPVVKKKAWQDFEEALKIMLAPVQKPKPEQKPVSIPAPNHHPIGGKRGKYRKKHYQHNSN